MAFILSGSFFFIAHGSESLKYLLASKENLQQFLYIHLTLDCSLKI